MADFWFGLKKTAPSGSTPKQHADNIWKVYLFDPGGIPESIALDPFFRLCY
jgi:hypothetical protein